MKVLTGSRAALVPALAYAAMFVVLSVDAAVRVWDWRAKFEAVTDVAVLLHLEATRTLVTLAGIALAIAAMRRASRMPALASLALSIAFATIFYTKVIAFRGFAGSLQGAAAVWVREHDVPQWALSVVFGSPEWAAWPALGGLLLFAALYPRPLAPVDVESSGSADRAGALRGVPLAGSDIGRSVRNAAARLLRGNALRPSHVWLAAAAAGALHTVLLLAVPAFRTAIHAVFIVAAAIVAAICVALLRAGHHVSDEEERRLPAWLKRGGLLAAALFSLAALSALLLPGSALIVVLMSLAPAALAFCLVPAITSVKR